VGLSVSVTVVGSVDAARGWPLRRARKSGGRAQAAGARGKLWIVMIRLQALIGVTPRARTVQLPFSINRS
jgi:hypothetical protein